MGLPQIVARNQSQVTGDTSLKGNENSIGTTPTILYTVPAGKKAIVTAAAARFVSGGANTNLDITIAGERIFRESAAPSPPVLQDIPNVKGMVMLATETIVLLGDSGSDNGSMNFLFTFNELPA